MTSPLDLARAAQAQAADPKSSAFVSANAGSGKTHVLINRVTRLLMAGIAPQNILCVTYTKAAAAEMLNRLFDRLGSYSIMKDADLANALRELDPRIPTGKADLRRARALFALALETPGGLKIRTLHGFCESLLRRFPAEAGISPGFTVLDDRLGTQIHQQCSEKIGLEALHHKTGDLALAIEHVVTLGADALDSLYKFAARDGRRITRLLRQYGGRDKVLAISARQLGISIDATAQSEAEAGLQRLDNKHLKRMADALMGGSPANQKHAETINQALLADDPLSRFEILWSVFFTQKNEPRKKIAVNAVLENHPWLVEALPSVQATLENIKTAMDTAAVLQNTRAALVLIEAYDGHYQRAKAAMGALDFDDLIEKSVALVEHSDAAQWVLYKLDYDLSHILVDEAQDNSDGQWELVRRLSAEFFSGKGAREETRTLFAVGDPKQSIYSFQGANPALFKSEAGRLSGLSDPQQHRFCLPKLALSWRSTAEVLAMVDETFAPLVGTAPETKLEGDAAHYQGESAGAPGFVDYIAHQAQRSDAPGCVELWAPVPRPLLPPEEDPFAPVDAPSPLSSRNQLAANIAINIAQWLAKGEQISEKQGQRWQQRALRPGDIMILVRSRTGGLFEEMIRQLKLRAIPVAGADRMVLSAQTAVRDLLSAARAALQDADDLALAEFLKGPFLHPADAPEPGIDEDALFDLATGRKKGQTLAEALALSEDVRFAEAQALMQTLRGLAGEVAPFSFFAGLLYRPSHTGESYARRLFARLGVEAEDPVREFLGKALAHQSEQAPALARFVAQNLDDESQIKREMESAGNAVRVMTVHAAKGLEAPLVILPDTAKGPGKTKENGLMFGPEGAFFWSPQAKKDPPVCANIRERATLRSNEEHSRLLYVAMTRAQDRLVICGAKMGNGAGKIEEESWFAHCENAFARLSTSGKVDEFETASGTSAKRYGPPPTLENAAQSAPEKRVDLPAWTKTILPPEADAPRRAAPSRWLEDEDDHSAVLSPLAEGGTKRYQRGLLIHSLLQTLPDIARGDRKAAAQHFLQNRPELDEAQRLEIINAVFDILDTPDFAELFGPDSRAELPITGQVDVAGKSLILAGQIDRLLVTKTQVLVVDYKTNRPAPKTAEAVSLAYLRQMAAYRTLLQSLWPKRKIRCALLWTDGPHLMHLPDSLLDLAVQKAHTP
jgi:ATP-dependent helicase/nuclease subunit A